MILVTVGTAVAFDDLIEEIDSAAGSGAFGDEKVIFQVGKGEYKPKFGEYFATRANISCLLQGADLVICHGGMTVMECIFFSVPFIATPNPAMSDNHQYFFLENLSKQLAISWAKTPKQVPKMIRTQPRRPVEIGKLVRPFDDMAGFLFRS